MMNAPEIFLMDFMISCICGMIFRSDGFFLANYDGLPNMVSIWWSGSAVIKMLRSASTGNQTL